MSSETEQYIAQLNTIAQFLTQGVTTQQTGEEIVTEEFEHAERDGDDKDGTGDESQGMDPGEAGYQNVKTEYDGGEVQYSAADYTAVEGQVQHIMQTLAESEMSVSAQNTILGPDVARLLELQQNGQKLRYEINHELDVKDGGMDMRVQCDQCDKNFRRESYLQVHKKAVHSAINPYTCDQCQRSFTSSWGLKMHMTVHSDDRPFQCKLCDKKFKRNYELNKHMAFHVPDRPYICNICGKSFQVERNLKTHQYVHFKPDLPYECDHPECDMRFHKISRMKEHYTIVHVGERNCICPVCNKTFKRQADVRTHVKNVHGEKPYACSICSRSFPSEGIRDRHMVTHNTEKPHRCEACHKSYKSKKELNIHLKWSHNPFPCNRCTKSFNSQEELDDHFLKHPVQKQRADNTPKKTLIYPCANCSKFFRKKENLEKHSETCKPTTLPCNNCDAVLEVKEILEKIYVQCEMCLQYMLAKDLQAHIFTTHVDNASFLCNGCNLTFDGYASLKEHNDTQHSGMTDAQSEEASVGAPSYFCDLCHHDFPTQREVEAHEKSHYTLDSNFKCETCQKVFKKKDLVRRHVKSHFKQLSDLSVYKCGVCNKEYKKSHYLDLHMKTHTELGEDGSIELESIHVVNDGDTIDENDDDDDGAAANGVGEVLLIKVGRENEEDENGETDQSFQLEAKEQVTWNLPQDTSSTGYHISDLNNAQVDSIENEPTVSSIDEQGVSENDAEDIQQSQDLASLTAVDDSLVADEDALNNAVVDADDPSLKIIDNGYHIGPSQIPEGYNIDPGTVQGGFNIFTSTVGQGNFEIHATSVPEGFTIPEGYQIDTSALTDQHVILLTSEGYQIARAENTSQDIEMTEEDNGLPEE